MLVVYEKGNTENILAIEDYLTEPSEDIISTIQKHHGDIAFSFVVDETISTSDIHASYTHFELEEDINGDVKIKLTDNLTTLRQEKIQELNQRCEASILKGFTSQTTGHVYEFDTYDQFNFTQQMLLMISDPAITSVDWKTEDAGAVSHTRDDFLAVCREAENHKRGNITRYWSLKEQVEQATTKEEIESIVW